MTRHPTASAPIPAPDPETTPLTLVAPPLPTDLVLPPAPVPDDPTVLDHFLRAAGVAITCALGLVFAALFAFGVALAVWAGVLFVAVLVAGLLPWPVTVVAVALPVGTLALHLATRRDR